MKRKCLHIKDIDADAVEEDIRDALINAKLIDFQDHLEIKALRPQKNGNQSATILVELSDSTKILGMGKLRVGLNICQVQERLEILRCFRCWAYDHKANRCNGEDRSKKCHKCTRDGHKARDCNEELFCPHCNENGHAAGNGRCKAFQQALRSARRETDRRNKKLARSQSSN